MCAEVGNGIFQLWINTAQNRPANPTTRHHRTIACLTVQTIKHDLSLHIGCSSQYLWHLAGLCSHPLPIHQGTIHTDHFDMRRYTQNPGAQFFLEAIHDGQHDDERSHTQCNAHHGQAGNKRYEAVVLANLTTATDVSQSDQ